MQAEHSGLVSNLIKFNNDASSNILELGWKFTDKGTISSADHTSKIHISNHGPRNSVFVSVKHLMPKPISADCSVKEYSAFKRSFEIWITSSYPAGFTKSDLWNTFNKFPVAETAEGH